MTTAQCKTWMFQETELKTVLVFDTDDEQGMRDTYKIMSYLVDQHLMKQLPSKHKLDFGKIEFIKAVRAFAAQCLKNKDPYPNSLSEAKIFVDDLWSKKNEKRIKDML